MNFLNFFCSSSFGVNLDRISTWSSGRASRSILIERVWWVWWVGVASECVSVYSCVCMCICVYVWVYVCVLVLYIHLHCMHMWV